MVSGDKSYTKVGTNEKPFRRDVEDSIEHIDEGKNEKHISSFSLEDSVEWEKGTVQTPEFRDKYFAVAFLAHLVVISVGASLASKSNILTSRNAEDDEIEQQESAFFSQINGAFILFLVVVSWVVSLICSYASLEVIKNNGVKLIQGCLLMNIAICSVLSIIFLVLACRTDISEEADMFMKQFIIFLILAIFFVIYTKIVWKNIPFAASNLKCGVVALKKNLGVAGFSFVSPVILLLIVLLQIMALIGFLDAAGVFDEYEDDGNASSTIISIFIILSFYWTTQVIKNVSVVTVSGTVGTWWFSPNEANSFCSSAVRDSFYRAITYSFGSICFGSLVVAIIQFIADYLRRLQRNRSFALFYCIIACLLSYIERLAEYFNKWAFVYVGLYGYGYVEAGKNVITLFKARGWTSIVTDRLVARCLAMMSVAVGLVSGSLAAVIGSLGGIGSGSVSQDALIGFFTGFLFGLFNTGSIYAVLESAVDTIVVCFAEAPSEFESNHPELSREMHQSWSSTWPNISLQRQIV